MIILRKYGRIAGLAAAAIAAVTVAAPAVQAQGPTVRENIRIRYHDVGQRSAQHCFEGLCVTLEVRRVNVNQGRSEICANFHRARDSGWSGGYRLTGRDDNSTHASLRVASHDEVRRCEILPVQERYYVVLRQDR